MYTRQYILSHQQATCDCGTYVSKQLHLAGASWRCFFSLTPPSLLYTFLIHHRLPGSHTGIAFVTFKHETLTRVPNNGLEPAACRRKYVSLSGSSCPDNIQVKFKPENSSRYFYELL